MPRCGEQNGHTEAECVDKVEERGFLASWEERVDQDGGVRRPAANAADVFRPVGRAAPSGMGRRPVPEAVFDLAEVH